MAKSSERPWASALISAAVLGVFAVLGASLVGLTYVGTADRIAQSEREALYRQLNAVLPRNEYDNELLKDYIDIQAPRALGAERTRVYRARHQGERVALIFSPVIAQGYSGGIKLVIGVHEDGRLSGVRVLSHQETPGLGDKIDAEKSPWILGFAGKSLEHPAEDQWKVKRDGGAFDQFTGATITPRGVVAAIKKALQYFRKAHEQLFEAPSQYEEPDHG